MPKPLDPAARLGIRVLLVVGALFVISEIGGVIITLVRTISGDMDAFLGVVRMLYYFAFTMLALRLMSKGRRRLRLDAELARHPSAGA